MAKDVTILAPDGAQQNTSRPLLTGVGLGPGDPDLVTLKGLKAIQHADLIFVPRSRDSSSSLALRIAEPHIDRSRQRVVELPLPMTRNADQLVEAWQGAADTIAATFASCATPQKGVYLLLGDPLLYGTFTYIWGELRARHPLIHVEVVPGVTSFSAAAAAAGVPLSATSDRVAIVPASYETDEEALRALIDRFDTIVLMKAGPVLPQLLQRLESLGLLGSTIYAERVGMPEERIVTDLRKLPAEPAPYLSLLIVRKTEKNL